MKYIILSTIATIICFSCSPKKTSENIQTVEININDTSTLIYSDFKESITIPLETNDKCLIDNISFTNVLDSLIFICDKKQGRILCYNFNGKYQYDIGQKGRGPSEFLGIADFYIKGDTLCVYDFNQKSILYYNPQGLFLYKTELPQRVSKIFPKQNSSEYIALNSFGIKNSPKILWLDKDFMTITTSKEAIAHGATLPYTFSQYHDNVYYVEMMNDTIFLLKDHEIIPHSYISFKEYSIPPHLTSYQEKLNYCIQYPNNTAGIINNVIEINNHLTFTFLYNGNNYWVWLKNAANSISSYKLYKLSKDFNSNKISRIINLDNNYLITESSQRLNDFDNPTLLLFKL